MNPSKRRRSLSQVEEEVNDFHPMLKKLLPKLPDAIACEYTHGREEMGADFVLARKNPIFGHTEYIGIIAKIGKIGQNFVEVERQIDECRIERFFQGGKRKIHIDEVWVILTGSITSGAQRKIHEKFPAQKIEFVTGNKLEELIDRYLPSFWTDASLEVGEYLNEVRLLNKQLDQSMNIVLPGCEDIYIQQDIVEAPLPGYKIDKKALFSREKRINIYEAIHKERFILIEGGMGAGKSKLIRHLIDHYTDPEVYSEEAVLPVPSTYKDFADKYSFDIKALIDDCVRAPIREELQNPHFLVLLDALDEKRMTVTEQVEALDTIARSLPAQDNTTILLTSRFLDGLDVSEKLKPVQRYELRPLSLNRTIEFLSKLCVRLNIKEQIIEDLRKSKLFKELPHNPMVAILLAKLLNENHHDLPSNLPELYSKYIELSLGRWDIQRGLQSQKEYEAMLSIMMEMAQYVIDNELQWISISEVKGRFESYLKERNLDIRAESLFDFAAERSEVLAVNRVVGAISFKHRSFAEFLYAERAKRFGGLSIDARAFQLYWMNVFYFYVGILKDCPDIIEKLVNLQPENHGERWLKVVNMSNYFLAGYASPYNVVEAGVERVMIEAARLYRDVVEGVEPSLVSTFPRMTVFLIIQALIKGGYSYEFLRLAIETAALAIHESDYSTNDKMYAIFFLALCNAKLEHTNTIDFLLEAYGKELPVDLRLLLQSQTETMGINTEAVKRFSKKLQKSLKGNRSLVAEIERLARRPITPNLK